MGREQAGTRPLLVVSADLFNASRAELVVVVPLTSVDKGIPWHVPIDAPEGGVRKRSYIKCEDIRSGALQRLIERWGEVTTETLMEVEDRLRRLLSL